MALSPGTWLNHYEVLGRLGTGENTGLGRNVALKIGKRTQEVLL